MRKINLPLILTCMLLLFMSGVACSQLNEDKTPTTTPAASETATTVSINNGEIDGVLEALEQGLANVYNTALPSVVDIRVMQEAQVPFGSAQVGEGSGFVWSADGYIVTNNHVVEGADTVTVSFSDGTLRDATVVGTDVSSDLAVIKIDPPAGLKALPQGDNTHLQVGDIAIAIGNPFSQNFTMTFGVVSALGRTFENPQTNFSNPNMIQTDAAINPGNSGGPLLDRMGNVIGINASIISDSGGNAGIGFAIPINTAKRVIPALISDGRYKHPYMGITGMTLIPEMAITMGLPSNTRGAMVVSVVRGGPADDAGVQGAPASNETEHGLPYGGDIITAIGGTAIKSMDDVIAIIADKYGPGDEVTLDILRTNGERTALKMTLGERPR